jgi:hypothetical protein
MVTRAALIAEPEASVTVPRREVVACPQAAFAHKLSDKKRNSLEGVRMGFPLFPIGISK